MHWSEPTSSESPADPTAAGGSRTDATRSPDTGRVLGLVVATVGRLLVGSVVAAIAILRLRTDALVVLAVLASIIGVVGAVRVRSVRRHARRDAVVVADGDALAPMLGDVTRRHDWRVLGAFGRCERSARARGVRWIGGTHDLERFVDEHHVDVVVVASDSMRDDSLRVALARARRSGVDVVIDAGLRGVDGRRLRPVGARDDGWWSLRSERFVSVRAIAKRSLDVVVASVALLLASPVMVLAALAVKTADGGPILFEQWRIGRGGRRFRMRKFRTMVVDAESQLVALAARNERRGGPLFKLDDDPRVTLVGRLLRATSIDELPQLFNVLGGTMSLVGPRPALPSEVAEFDARLHTRHDVRPGITGLWQIEARDDESFAAYRRCDVYYVENWSLRLDLAILARTIPAVVGRGWRSLRRRPTASVVRWRPPTAGVNAGAVTGRSGAGDVR